MNVKDELENCIPTYTISKEDLEKMYPTSRALSELSISSRMSYYITSLVNKAKQKVKK